MGLVWVWFYPLVTGPQCEECWSRVFLSSWGGDSDTLQCAASTTPHSPPLPHISHVGSDAGRDRGTGRGGKRVGEHTFKHCSITDQPLS